MTPGFKDKDMLETWMATTPFFNLNPGRYMIFLGSDIKRYCKRAQYFTYQALGYKLYYTNDGTNTKLTTGTNKHVRAQFIDWGIMKSRDLFEEAFELDFDKPDIKLYLGAIMLWKKKIKAALRKAVLIEITVGHYEVPSDKVRHQKTLMNSQIRLNYLRKIINKQEMNILLPEVCKETLYARTLYEAICILDKAFLSTIRQELFAIHYRKKLFTAKLIINVKPIKTKSYDRNERARNC